MPNCTAVIFQSISNRDEALTENSTYDIIATINVSLSLMELKSSWQLELDRLNYKFLVESLNPDPAGAMKSKATQVEYDTAVSQSDAQTNAVQQIVDSLQAKVNSDNDSRAQNFQTADTPASMLSFSTNILKKQI